MPVVSSFVEAILSWLELDEAGVVVTLVALNGWGVNSGLALGNALLFIPVICLAI